MLTFPAAVLLYTFFDIFLLKNEDDRDTEYFSSRAMIGRGISKLLSVTIYLSLVIPLFSQRFQVRKFFLVNPGEIICKPHAQNCFTDEIPRSFDYNGLENKFCSFIFPPGYQTLAKWKTQDGCGYFRCRKFLASIDAGYLD